MYAVISGAKTFTLLPPTDVLYLKQTEYSTMKYQLKSIYLKDDCNEVCQSLNEATETLPVLNERLKSKDLELTRQTCPSESLYWISTNPDDPNVLKKSPHFKYAHPIRCTVLPGEILYIPGRVYLLWMPPCCFVKMAL